MSSSFQKLQFATVIYVCSLLLGCSPAPETATRFDPAFYRLTPLECARLPLAVGFDSPMGGEQGAFIYDAQPFRRNQHLGSDFNGIGGQNTDLGDPVYASGDGEVLYAREATKGWGKMVILGHRMPASAETAEEEVIQTIYAHLDQIDERVRVGSVLSRGTLLGTVGTANGLYKAHLHFEVRISKSINPSVGYSDRAMDRLSPSLFLKQHAPSDREALAPSYRNSP